MIWKFDFGRNTLLWILGIAFALGAGVRGFQAWTQSDSALGVGLVTGTPEARELRRQADSLMQARQERLKAPIDVNRATVIDLQRVPGIGPKLSARIVDYREEYGPFRTIDDLDPVPGIGPVRLEAIREHCVIGESD